MRNALQAPILAALLTTAVSVGKPHAEDAVLPATIVASASTGYWQDEDAATPTNVVATPAPAPAPRHGYYKLYAVRQSDRTSKVYLQRIAATDDGPQILSTTELPEITAMKVIVTDIRPENSGGIIREPGLFATVFIRKDADVEAEAWNITLDDLGEIGVAKASE